MKKENHVIYKLDIKQFRRKSLAREKSSGDLKGISTRILNIIFLKEIFYKAVFFTNLLKYNTHTEKHINCKNTAH